MRTWTTASSLNYNHGSQTQLCDLAKSHIQDSSLPSPAPLSLPSDVELLSMDSTKASCWVNNKLRAHEEQWKEDDCTFCQCVDGEPHCTAMACKQSCQNPVKIPGECCPFCEGTETSVGSSNQICVFQFIISNV